MPFNTSHRGLVLPSFLLLSVLLFATVLYTHESLMQDKSWSKHIVDEKKALHLAAGGVLQALAMLKENPELGGEIIRFQHNTSSLSVWVEALPHDLKRIRSLGTVNEVKYEALETFNMKQRSVHVHGGAMPL